MLSPSEVLAALRADRRAASISSIPIVPRYDIGWRESARRDATKTARAVLTLAALLILGATLAVIAT